MYQVLPLLVGFSMLPDPPPMPTITTADALRRRARCLVQHDPQGLWPILGDHLLKRLTAPPDWAIRIYWHEQGGREPGAIRQDRLARWSGPWRRSPPAPANDSRI